MSDPVVYRSNWPEVIDAWEKGIVERREWSVSLDAFATEYGRKPMVVKGFGGEHPAGLQPADGDELNPPEGWRLDARHGVLVPDKRRKAGKALAETIKALGVSGKPSLPGMPTETFAPGRFLSPGMQRVGNHVYVRWSAEPDPGPSDDVWERCPLSTYYAAVELASESEGETP